MKIREKINQMIADETGQTVEKIAKDTGISKSAAAGAVNSFLGNITKELKKKNGKVTLVGFGTFTKVRRKARKGRNPQTGETIKIAASTQANASRRNSAAPDIENHFLQNGGVRMTSRV